MTQFTWDTAWQGTPLFPCELEPLDVHTTHLKPRLIISILIAVLLTLTVMVGVVGFKRTAYKIPDTANVQVASGIGLVQNRLVTVPVTSISLPSPISHPKPAHKAQVKANPHPLASRSGSVNISQNDEQWLAQLIEAEAGNQSYTGKVAVGNVVVNRAHSYHYPHTIQGVIFEKGQFETVSNGRIHNRPTAEDYRAARAALSGENVVGNALYFENPSIVRARGYDWMGTRVQIACIGGHCFYR